MMDFRDVERENKVYVNDKAIVLDKDSVTPSELLEMADFSSLVYDLYLKQEENKETKKKGKGRTKENKPLSENKRINIQTGMHFEAILKQS